MSPSKVQAFLTLATQLSRKYSHDMPVHLAAILVNKGKVASIGYNQMKTHPKSTHPYKTLHAEVDCLIGIPEGVLRESSLFVARTGFHGRSRVLLARPCPFCQIMIRRAGVRDTYFTTDTGYGVLDR